MARSQAANAASSRASSTSVRCLPPRFRRLDEAEPMDISELAPAPITYAGLRALGLSRPEIRRAESAGMLRRLLHGVYVRGDALVTTEVRLAAAVLVINPSS